MYPYYMHDGSFFAVVLMVVIPLALLAALAWTVAAFAVPPDDNARRIARERFARGEISREDLGVLLQAL